MMTQLGKWHWRPARGITRKMRVPQAVLILAFIALPAAYGQDSGGSSSSGGRREDAFQRKLQRVVQLEMIESALARDPGSTSDRDPQLVLKEIKEDFWRVQVVNNEIIRAINYRGAIDLRFIAKSASEIKGRAGRLKENLALPRSPNEAKRSTFQADTNPEQLRSSISQLSKLIVGFVNNPVFREANVVDATLSIKARQDLEEIAGLSDHIRKSTDQLRRAREKSR